MHVHVCVFMSAYKYVCFVYKFVCDNVFPKIPQCQALEMSFELLFKEVQEIEMSFPSNNTDYCHALGTFQKKKIRPCF